MQPVTLQQVNFRRFYYSDKLSGCSVLIILVISVGGIQHWQQILTGIDHFKVPSKFICFLLFGFDGVK